LGIGIENSLIAGYWSLLRHHRSALVGMIILTVFVLISVSVPFLVTHRPDEADISKRLAPPSRTHWLGTDRVGKDVYSRLLYGSRISIKIGLVAVAGSVLIGSLFGLLAGYYGGQIDNLLMRGMDILLALPSVLLAIVIVTILGASLTNAIVAVSIVYIPQYARILRAAVLKVKELEYVLAARAVGASDWHILLTVVIPNCLAPLIVQATLGMGAAILDAAGLSFLGLGAKVGQPEWGLMLRDHFTLIRQAPWTVLAPGLAIFSMVLGFNLLGDALRDILDPQVKTT